MPCATCCQATDWSTARQHDPSDGSVLAFLDRFPAIRDANQGLSAITWHLSYDGAQYLAEWGDTGTGALPSRDPRGELALYDLSDSGKLKWRTNATTPNELPPTIEDSCLFVSSDAVWCIGGNNNVCTIRDIADGKQTGTVSTRPHPVHSRPHGAYLHTFRSTRIQRFDKTGTLIDQSDNTGSAGFTAPSLNYLAKSSTTYDELTTLTDLTVETGYTAAGAGTVVWIGADDSGIYRLRQIAFGNLMFEKYKAGGTIFSVSLGTTSGFTNGHVFDGLVFLRNTARTSISCRNATTGAELWSDNFSLDQTQTHVVGSNFYMPNNANGVIAIVSATGVKVWTAPDSECACNSVNGDVWIGGNRVAV